MVLGVARGDGLRILLVLSFVLSCYGEFSPGTVGVGEVVSLGEGDDGVSEPTTPVVVVSGSSGVPTKASRLVTAAEEDDERDELMIGSSSSSPEYEGSPAPAVPVPEDSSRGKVVPVYNSGSGYGVEIDRRKVPGGVHKDGGSGGAAGSSQDLSFTGILNGLLDSFINDPPPQQSPPRQKPSTTTPSPASDDTSTEVFLSEDDEEEEEEEVEASPEEHTPQKSSSSKKQKQQEDTSEPLLTNSEEQQLEEEGEEEDDDAALLEALSEASNSTSTTKHPPTRRCEGECRNIIFGLFLCDEIDNDAFCSEPGLACCVNNNQYSSYGNLTSSEEVNLANEHDLEDGLEDDEDVATQQQSPPISQPPNRYQNKYNRVPPQPMRGPPPPHHHHHYNPHNPYYYSQQQQQQPQQQPSQQQFHHPPPQRMPLPCPRYCVKNFLESYCTDRLPSQFACGVDGFCCAHDVPVNSHNKDENGDDGDGGDNNNDDEDGGDVYRNEGVGGDDEDSDGSEKNKVIGPCTEEIGSCVSRNIISIICFGHATPTEMYTCPRPSMKCCARKTALPKDSLPQTTTPPPPKLPDNSRNASSVQQQFQKQPSIHHIQQQVLPQFAPHPHHPQQHPQYTQQQPFQQPNTAQTAPPLAETPPPLLHSSSSPNQFTQFISPSSTNSLSRIPPRQPVGQYVCGVKGVPTVSKKKKRRRKKRVVGGSDSLPGEWCWQVALINSLNQYLCGGALIGTQWVLTAAHCVTNIVRSGDAIYVRVGDHDLTSRYGSPGAQTLRVATTYIHHNHNSQTLDNDIALLKLQGNAALKEGVCLVCLPSRNHMSEIPGKRCIVTGYGYMGESGPIPLRIREANLPIVSEEECVRKVNAVTEKVFALPMSSFCAGGELRNDACQGDGGGPLVCRADDPTTGDPGTGYYELTGLVSWGFGCGRENVPGVYVKVSSFIGWIHQIIRSN